MMMKDTRDAAAEWNLVVATQITRDHEAAIREDMLRTAETGCANGLYGWAAGLTRTERADIESRCR